MKKYAVMIALAIVSAGCRRTKPHPGSASAPMEPQRTGQTAVFDCTDSEGEDFSFTTKTGPGELALWLPERFGGRYLVLGQVRAASGAKYKSGGDVEVWNKGDEALLEVNGATYTGCTEDLRKAVWEEARISGVDFRAVGQEPGWHLDIREGERIRFVYAYGRRRVTVAAPAPRTDEQQRTVYSAETEAHDLTVTITDEQCTDAMNGERFPSTARVVLDGNTYRGCGRALR